MGSGRQYVFIVQFAASNFQPWWKTTIAFSVGRGEQTREGHVASNRNTLHVGSTIGSPNRSISAYRNAREFHCAHSAKAGRLDWPLWTGSMARMVMPGRVHNISATTQPTHRYPIKPDPKGLPISPEAWTGSGTWPGYAADSSGEFGAEWCRIPVRLYTGSRELQRQEHRGDWTKVENSLVYWPRNTR